jgi:outer membrane protein assembly factor BamB
MKSECLLGVVTIFLVSISLIVPVYCNESTNSNLQGESDAGWHQFHLNPQHTGASSAQAPRTNETAWIRDINTQAGSSVAVAEGKVFVNCVDEIVSLDQFSGETLWSAPFENNRDVCCSWHTPAYHDGNVFFTGMDTACLNATTGEVLWSFASPTGRGAVDGSPVIFEGKVIVSDWDGQHYYCLDEMTGEELWRFEVDGNAQSTPAVSDDKVIFGDWEWGLGGHIYCADLEEGFEVWNITTDNSPCGSATIVGGTVYMTTYNFDGEGDLLALSLEDGSLIWKKTVERTDSTPTVVEGKIYVCGGCDGFSYSKAYCFDSASGDLIWETYEADKIGDWRCSMAYADGIVFAGKPDFDDFGGTVALDAKTGDMIWSYPEGGSSPAVADGMVFTTGNGKVYAFGPEAVIG